MKKVLFIDRDGTLIAEPEDFQVDRFSKLRFLPGVVTYLGKIACELDYELVMVSNQDGLGTESLPDDAFYPVHNFVLDLFANEGIDFTDVCIDSSFEHQQLPTRKPRTGMLTKYSDGDYDLANSFVIGDRVTDVQLAENLGCKAIFLRGPYFEPPASNAISFTATDWQQIYEYLRRPSRLATRHRTTNETDILVELDLDGTGSSDISTGIAFYDHMLDQLARHSSIDLKIKAKGDLHIDEHHTIEDVAITLGEAFSEALGDKRGIERYGFTLPMDDCLTTVALDFSGRNWIVWNADFKREKIGEMPTEMFFHFFKSFTDHAKCNLNIKAEGTNEHHKIESIFKAFARAVKMAVSRESESGMAIPSTKGTI